MAGKARCRVHGGTSTGARSVDGKKRQAEGRRRYLRELRGQQGGPPQATLPGAPVRLSDAAAFASPVDRMRLDALASLPPQPAPLSEVPRAEPEPPPQEQAVGEEPEWLTIQDGCGNPITVKVTPPETFSRVLNELFPDSVVPALRQVPTKPALAITNPAPNEGPPAVLPPVIVEDTSKLATEVEDIAQAAIERIKELLKHPFDNKDPNFAALLRFLSSTYNTSMTTIARTDDTRLKRQAVSRLDTILERVAQERLKRDARRTIEGATAAGLCDTRTIEEVPDGDAS
jgi:hypothetical protein